MNFITQDIPIRGGLASQIQQYMSLYAVATETNKEIVFRESLIGKGGGFAFNKILNIPVRLESDSFFENFTQFEHNHSLIVDKSCFDLNQELNYELTGRFDLFHYWYPRYKDYAMNLEWNSLYYEVAKKQKKELSVNGKELVSIHVRRGDYLLPQHHHFCILGIDYYTEALSYFMGDIEKYHFVVFSNDIEWCKENLIEGDMVSYIGSGEGDFGVPPPSDLPPPLSVEPSEKALSDLIFMSLCEHNIIANSSYSWWAAFKNKNENKKVICPKNYLKNYSSFNHINGNYYPPEWIAINNFNG